MNEDERTGVVEGDLTTPWKQGGNVTREELVRAAVSANKLSADMGRSFLQQGTALQDIRAYLRVIDPDRRKHKSAERERASP